MLLVAERPHNRYGSAILIRDDLKVANFYERVQGIVEIGYFNSHSTSKGFDTPDNNGEAVEQWAYSCDLTLIHDAKLQKSFNSARSTYSHTAH